MEIEADAKHVPLMLKTLKIEKVKIVDAPRVKMSKEEAVAAEASPALSARDATACTTMRASYLSQDRVDISEAVKCLA